MSSIFSPLTHEIVCTHFLPTQLLGDLRSRNFTALKRIQQIPISCVFTDYEVQFMWVHNVDKYYTPNTSAFPSLARI